METLLQRTWTLRHCVPGWLSVYDVLMHVSSKQNGALGRRFCLRKLLESGQQPTVNLQDLACDVGRHIRS